MRLAFFIKRISDSNFIDERQQISPQILSTNFPNHTAKLVGSILGSFVPVAKKQQIVVNWLGIVVKVMVGLKHF